MNDETHCQQSIKGTNNNTVGYSKSTAWALFRSQTDQNVFEMAEKK